MSEFRGSVGNWFIHNEDEKFYDYDILCDYGDSVGIVANCIEDINDAKLIASAPELLEALQKLLAEYEGVIHHEFGVEHDDDVIRAKAAINKALGVK